MFNHEKFEHQSSVLFPMAPWIEELDVPYLDINVSIQNITPIFPAGSIPVSPGDTLYLSNLDDMIGTRVFTPTVYFYRSNSQHFQQTSVSKILKDSLSRVLVPYYPFSGRLREMGNGKLEVFFGNNQGVLFIEAKTQMGLENLGNLSVPNPAWISLIYKFKDEEPYKLMDMPLLIAQVTQFSCGGFSIGLRTCHCLCDGLGAMQFLNTWATTARTGSLVVDPLPCWDREVFQPHEPPRVEYPHTEFKRVEERSSLTKSLWQVKPVQKCYKINRDYQCQVKNLAQSEGNFSCTTFDALSAHIWRSWVKALDVKPQDYELRLTFSVNARMKLFNPPLRDGFYGNAVCIAYVTSKVHDLVHGCFSETTKSVREARLGVSEDYVRSTIDFVEVDRPKMLEFGGKLTITQWTRFSIYESADFGWGRPVYAGPIDLTPTPQVCVLLPCGGRGGGGGGGDDDGAMVVCICLPESATNKFKELLDLFDPKDCKV